MVYFLDQILPSELEDILYSHPAVVDAGVVGIPESDGGEIPRAYVSLKSGTGVSEEVLRSFVNGTCYKCIECLISRNIIKITSLKNMFEIAPGTTVIVVY